MTYLASSAGALIVDRNTWTSRANQAWGPSDVWNSGSSWEYLTGYHGWVGRTYNVGESWEAAYNRVYTDRYNAGYSAGYSAGVTAAQPPPNVDAASYYVETAISGSWSTTDGTPGVTWSLTLPLQGHWQVSIEAYIIATAIGGGANGYVDVVATGPIADSPTQYFRWGSTDQQVRGGYGKSAHGVYGAGTAQTWRIPSTWRTANGSVSGKIVAHFVPTQTYPR